MHGIMGRDKLGRDKLGRDKAAMPLLNNQDVASMPSYKCRVLRNIFFMILAVTRDVAVHDEMEIGLGSVTSQGRRMPRTAAASSRQP